MTEKKIIDYAWTRPGLDTLVKNSVWYVGRYIGQDKTGKNMTLKEVEELNGSAISVFTIFEFAAAQSTGGVRQSRIDGSLAKSMANDLGQPAGTPIYFACDFDIPDYAPNEDGQTRDGARRKLGPVGDYFAGLREFFPLERIGGYGGYWLCERLYHAGLASWFMQTIAWSGGQEAEHLNLYQNRTMFNGSADIDEYADRSPIHKGFGAWVSNSVRSPSTKAHITLRTNSGLSFTTLTPEVPISVNLKDVSELSITLDNVET